MAIHKLTAAKIAKLTADGVYGDGGGLWFQVTNGGRGKSWVFRWKDRLTGRDRNMGLGPLHTVSIDEAREKALVCRKQLLERKDPLVERDGVRLDIAHRRGVAKTLSQVIDELLDNQIVPGDFSESWKKKARAYLDIARRSIGHMPIQRVDQNMIYDTDGLGWGQLYVERYTTAIELLGLLRRVFSLAISRKYYVGLNPARWKDNIENMVVAKRRAHQVTHRPALSLKEVGLFMQILRSYEDQSYRATGRTTLSLLMEFIVLAGGCRVSEARLATWNEIDPHKRVWTVPWPHHKDGLRSRKSLLRPLSEPMLAVLAEMERRHPNRGPNAFIFPSPRTRHSGGDREFDKSSVSTFISRTLNPLLVENKLGKFVPHGFRSNLSDWCKANNWPKAWYDLQLGHSAGTKTDQAYAREDLTNERRPMMDAWSVYCSQPAPEPIGGTNIESLAEHRRKTAS